MCFTHTMDSVNPCIRLDLMLLLLEMVEEQRKERKLKNDSCYNA